MGSGASAADQAQYEKISNVLEAALFLDDQELEHYSLTGLQPMEGFVESGGTASDPIKPAVVPS